MRGRLVVFLKIQLSSKCDNAMLISIPDMLLVLRALLGLNERLHQPSSLLHLLPLMRKPPISDFIMTEKVLKRNFKMYLVGFHSWRHKHGLN